MPNKKKQTQQTTDITNTQRIPHSKEGKHTSLGILSIVDGLSLTNRGSNGIEPVAPFPSRDLCRDPSSLVQRKALLFFFFFFGL